MFAVSYRGYGRVPSGLPDFFAGIMRQFFQASSQPLQNRRQLYSKRVTWAQAEMFVGHKLYLGYHPDYLEDKFQEEVDLSSQFTDFSRNIEGQDNVVGNNDEANSNSKGSNKFADATVVGRPMRFSGQRDRGNFTGHEKAASQRGRADMAYKGRGNFSSGEELQARDTAHVEFPDEPTMAESSTAGPLGNAGNHTAYILNAYRQRDRSRSRTPPHTARHYHNMESEGNTGRGRSDSIRRGDSSSQFQPNYNSSGGADFSRRRPNSPPNTSNQSNNGFSSHAPFSYMSGATARDFVEEQSRNRIRRDSPRRRGNDLRSLFKDLRVEDDPPHESRGRPNEQIFGRSNVRGGREQFQADDLESRSRYRSDSFINATSTSGNEFRHRYTSRTPQILKDRYNRYSGHDSDMTLPFFLSRPNRQQSRHRDDSFSQLRHRYSERESRPPVSYNRYKNLERPFMRYQGNSSNRRNSRPWSTILIPPASDAGESSRSERAHHSKRTKNRWPFKRH
ncbi:hypothetical protein IFR05_002643 [Cadophora sp. M221]|nr:hypothetical protein IFR05_002643 [Cadophora sp. M221]